MHDVNSSSMHGGSRSSGATVVDTATESKNPGVAEMMDEITALKQRIRELEAAEAHHHDDTQSYPSVDSGESAEMASLRKDVGRLENEKAKMELDFMNQLAAIARGHEEELTRIKAKLNTYEEENHMATKVTITGNSIEASELLKQQSEAMKQLKRDLSSADKELKITRQDMNQMTQKVSEADGIKSSLLQEITDLRLQLEQSSREKDALNDNILDVEKHYNAKFMEMEDELAERQTMDENREHELAEMNDCIIKLEGEKQMLLEEVTDLRLQLQKTDKAKQELKKEVDEWRSGEGASSPSAKVSELETEKDELSNELASLRAAFKAEKEKYEETISSQTVEISETKQEVEVAVSELTEANLKISSMREQELELKKTLQEVRNVAADKERHIAALETQRVNYEQRTSTCLLDHVVEADNAKDQVDTLRKEVALLKKQLEQERQRSSMRPGVRPLASNSWGTQQRNRALSPVSTPGSSSRPQGVLSPPSTPRRSLPSASTPKSQASPSSRSVLALAANFEKKANDTPRSAPAAARRFSNPNKQSPPPPVVEIETSYKEENYSALQAELDQKSAYVSALERRFEEELKRKAAEIKELRTQVESEQKENQELRSQLQKKQTEMDTLRREMATLESTRSALDRSKHGLDRSKHGLDRSKHGLDGSKHGVLKSGVMASTKEIERLRSQNKADTAEIERLMSQLEETCALLNEERRHVHELEEGIRKLTEEKVSYQEKTQTAFDTEAGERKREFDKEIDQLKMQLTQELVEKTRLAAAHKSQIDELEATIEELNRECDAELEEQQKELDEARSKLKNLTAELERMRDEKEQLCVSMNGVQNDRKDDFDSLHAEMMEKTAENANLSREIQSLQMKVQEQEEQSEELQELRKRVRQLEEQGKTSLFGPPSHNTQEVEDLTRENQRLRESVRKAAIEKRAMQEKVNSIVTDQGQSTSIKVLRERNAALKKEVERLSSKLRKYVKPKVTRVEL